MGMNDTVTAESTLTIGLLRIDGKSTQNIILKNPKTNLTAEQVKNLEPYLLSGGIVDSTTGEQLTNQNSELDTAYIKQQNIRDLDLS